MTRAQGWLLAFLASGALWLVILIGVSSIGHTAQPPACRGNVCQMTGPGGLILDWKLHVQIADLQGKRFTVPAHSVCASACAIAVGLGLYIGADIRIDPTATFIPHNLAAIKAETRMPAKFRKLMLAYRPFHYQG